jgi:hypothetical protein
MQIASIMKRLGKRSTGRKTLSRLTRLPDDSLARILGAPQTGLQVCTHTTGDRKLIAYLDDVISAEECRKGTSVPKKCIWSALGDARFDAGTCIASHLALRVDDTFVIDFDSPYCRQPLIESNFRPKFGDAIEFLPKQRESVETKLIEAINGIKTVSPVAYVLISEMIRTVMPRIDNNTPTYKGSSNRGMVGRINIFNPHLDGIDCGNIATSFVHEAIHILLYCFELRRPLVVDERAALDIRMTSPWSGTRVHLIALLHATFVWYGVLHFWLLPGVEQLFPENTVYHYRDFCLRGLENNRPYVALAEHAALVHTDVLATIQELQTNLAVG